MNVCVWVCVYEKDSLAYFHNMYSMSCNKLNLFNGATSATSNYSMLVLCTNIFGIIAFILNSLLYIILIY